MTLHKDLFINSIKLIEVNDRSNIPTVIFYESDKPSIGYDAFTQGETSNYLIENFKLELGNQDPSVINKNLFQVGKLKSLSAHGLTKDFIESVLNKTEDWIDSRGYKKASRILVAEPIAMGDKESVKASWLSNYRSHIKRILISKFENIDFLPEPFAVFQYYRYGVKHQLVAQKQKHVALVLDFGGGTFDVSVIETTASGDISAGGRNSRPLAASSRPVGGFFINDIVAESLIFEALPKTADKGEYQRAIRKFRDIKSNGDEVSIPRDDLRNFIVHYRKLIRNVENAKILICNQIQNWGIDAEFRVPVPAFTVNVPILALKEKTEYASIRLDAYKLREIFIKKVWNKELKPAICDALVRSESELKGQPISIVLMSGGSSNIRWIVDLIRNDNSFKLPNAEILELQENFQEIVAKGLAIECARRSFNEGDGDFKSITYNKLSLTLNPDGKGLEVKRFKPITAGLPTDSIEEGVLLPSSSILSKLIDQPIRWKVRLTHPPKHQLDYYFMRTSFDHEDMQNTFNVDHTALTKTNTKFDSNIVVELTIKEDGTAYPKFIYQEGQNGNPTYQSEGPPFFMDMTFGSEGGNSGSNVNEAYIGLDFGSSNSSISYVEKSAIKVYRDRSKDQNWLEFNDLLEVLPYPVAAPLAKYIASGNGNNQDSLALEAIEAFLGFAAFLSYCELCAIKGTEQTRFFKGFKQRSAGPLWALLRETQKKINSRSDFSKVYKRLFEEPFYSQIDKAVSELADFKHGKLSNDIDHFNILKILGNLTNQTMSGKIFGSFEDVSKLGFGKKGFSGQFRVAQGKNPPFIHRFSYEGIDSFSEEEIFVIDLSTGIGICLSPLYFWAQNVVSTRTEFKQLYIYDINKMDEFSFKATDLSIPLKISSSNEYNALFAHLKIMKDSDQEIALYENINLQGSSQF